VTEPDLALARRFLADAPPPGRLLLCAVTGSHAYGFPSPDSDLDLKGVHLTPTRALLGLDDPAPTHDRLTVFEDVECDLTTNEARAALRLLLGGNGNVLERIWSPYQMVEGADLEAWRRLAEGALSKRFFKHYGGYFGGMCRQHAQDPRAKSLLYTYRVALTGAHLLRTGECEMDLRRLAPEYGFPEALELVAYNQASAEKSALPADEDARHRASWTRLDALLQRARDESPLPEGPANAAACEAWLVGARLRDLSLC
jgi:predicted nucleotidyltransferase